MLSISFLKQLRSGHQTLEYITGEVMTPIIFLFEIFASGSTCVHSHDTKSFKMADTR